MTLSPYPRSSLDDETYMKNGKLVGQTVIIERYKCRCKAYLYKHNESHYCGAWIGHDGKPATGLVTYPEIEEYIKKNKSFKLRCEDLKVQMDFIDNKE